MTTTTETIQVRQDTSSNWSTNNPVPKSGEWCFETDTKIVKIGDGSTAYNSLPKYEKTDATKAELDKLHELETTKTELSHVHGVTSSIQEQLNSKFAKANIQTAFGETLSDEKVASEKLVKNTIDTKQDIITIGNKMLKASVLSSMNIIGENNDGKAYTEPKTYAKMLNAAHSTFDASKFTVVGTPTITDDGVVSQPTGTMVSTIAFDTITMADDFDIISPIVKVVDVSSITREQYFWNDSTNTFRTSFYGNYEDRIGFRYLDSNNGFKRLYTPILNTQNGDSYQIKISKRSGTIQLYYKKNNSEWLQGDATDDFLTTPTIVGFKTKQSATDVYSITTNAELDLKYASVIINGVEVFSGNKTGIDIVKDNDYTVVGTPTISADGVASGFSDSNYLTISPFMNVPQSLRITGEFNFPLNSNSQTLMAWFNGSTFLRLRTQSGRVFVQNCINNNYELNFSTSTANYYGKHTLDFVYKDNNVKILLDGDVVYNQSLTLDLTVLTQVSCGIGKMLGVNDWYALGSIDLNASKIYVDGNLANQPCLRIPYTETSDSKKFIDIIYNYRAKDMAEQFGSAPYTIIDETNNAFILPYGSVDSKVAPKILVDSGEGWEQYLDRTMVQRGTMTADTPVTFPCSDEYADTSFSLSCPYSAKSKTGFTPTVSGEYIAVGKV